jgi:transcriptional accessory protein Tex/SPT6
MCVIAEHQRVDCLSDDDLVCLTPAGFAHLDMVSNMDYLAACAEDAWVESKSLADAVARRIGRYGARQHYRRQTVRMNALEFVEHLVTRSPIETVKASAAMLNVPGVQLIDNIRSLRDSVKERVGRELAREGWSDPSSAFPLGSLRDGRVYEVRPFGVLVSLECGATGMLHKSDLLPGWVLDAFKPGANVTVKVLDVDHDRRRIRLAQVNTGAGTH